MAVFCSKYTVIHVFGPKTVCNCQFLAILPSEWIQIAFTAGVSPGDEPPNTPSKVDPTKTIPLSRGWVVGTTL